MTAGVAWHNPQHNLYSGLGMYNVYIYIGVYKVKETIQKKGDSKEREFEREENYRKRDIYRSKG